MLFEFLRRHEQGVDISRYLPKFLFDTDGENLKALLATCSWEHEKQRDLLQDIAKQFFVNTATWGLADWERIVEVRPNPGDSYQQRRNRILLKLNGTQTSTLDFMERLIKRYVSEDSVIRLQEIPEEYIFNIHFDGGQIICPSDMMEAIRIYIPAHLALSFWIERIVHMDSEEESVKYGLANLVDGMSSIGIARPDDFVLPYSTGVFTGGSGRRQVGAGPVELTAKLIEALGFAYVNSGTSNIPANLEDLPEWFRSITEPSHVHHKIGIGYDSNGWKKIPLATPVEGILLTAPMIMTGLTGSKHYGLGMPDDVENNYVVGSAHIRTGRIVILADRSDLPPDKRMRPHVGVMQTGLSAVG